MVGPDSECVEDWRSQTTFEPEDNRLKEITSEISGLERKRHGNLEWLNKLYVPRHPRDAEMMAKFGVAVQELDDWEAQLALLRQEQMSLLIGMNARYAKRIEDSSLRLEKSSRRLNLLTVALLVATIALLSVDLILRLYFRV